MPKFLIKFDSSFATFRNRLLPRRHKGHEEDIRQLDRIYRIGWISNSDFAIYRNCKARSPPAAFHLSLIAKLDSLVYFVSLWLKTITIKSCCEEFTRLRLDQVDR